MPKITLRLKAYETSSLKKAFSEISKIFFLISVCVTKLNALRRGFLPSHEKVFTFQNKKTQGIFSDKVVAKHTKHTPLGEERAIAKHTKHTPLGEKHTKHTPTGGSKADEAEGSRRSSYARQAAKRQSTHFFLKPFSLPSKFSRHKLKQRKTTHQSKVWNLPKNSKLNMSRKVSWPLFYQQMLVGRGDHQSKPIFSKVTNATPPKIGSLQKKNQLYFYDCKVFSYPKTRKLYTIIRSPHIHKKSKEQFEFVCKKKKITIKVKNVSFVSLFFFFLKNCQIPGVEVDFSVEYGTYLKI